MSEAGDEYENVWIGSAGFCVPCDLYTVYRRLRGRFFGLLACFAGGRGATLGLVALGVNIVNILLLSPLFIISATTDKPLDESHQELNQIMFRVLVLIQLLALVILLTRKIRDSREDPVETA